MDMDVFTVFLALGVGVFNFLYWGGGGFNIGCDSTKQMLSRVVMAIAGMFFFLCLGLHCQHKANLPDWIAMLGLGVLLLACPISLWLEDEDLTKAIKEEEEAAFQAWYWLKEHEEEEAQLEFEARYQKMMDKSSHDN